MEIKSYRPENPVLEPYIECFYTLKRGPEEEDITYLAFPGIYSMVCLNAGAKIELAGNNLSISYSPDSALETNLMRDFEYSGRISYRGAIDEIVIYFKPLGLNAFLEKNLRSYMSPYFGRFAPFEDYNFRMLKVFAIADDAQRIRTLETYWMSKLRGFEHPFLPAVIAEITGQNSAQEMNDKTSEKINEKTFSSSESARRHGISRTTLIRHFDLHIGTTPSQFKKIVRFRNAMKRHRDNLSRENLSDISHEADYFDQSHMIKDFRALTKYSPKDFFSKISKIEDGQINWLFL